MYRHVSEEDSDEEIDNCMIWEDQTILTFVNYFVATAVMAYTSGPAPLGTLPPELVEVVNGHFVRGSELLRAYSLVEHQLMQASHVRDMVKWDTWLELNIRRSACPDPYTRSEQGREDDTRFCLVPFKPMVVE
ncbi:hypothetical protein KIPB_004892, partial [Kipferlia bialata]|eukprot:g4892.t1